jgi:GH35 family endo-1,4-beta-xylanase
MRRLLWAVVGILSLGCAAADGESEAVGNDSLAVHGRRDERPRPCAGRDTSAFALPRAACDERRWVGTAVRADALAADAAYATTLAHEFSAVTPENAMKWGTLQPVDPEHWDFAQADAIVASARANDQAIKGHTLIWHQQLPPFVTDALPAAELERYIENNIAAVVGRFRGVVGAWDVVNEAIADDGSLRDTVFSRKFGSDYIARAFRRPHAADRRAKLYYNDYGTEVVNAKSNAVYELLRSLKQRGVPIDGVGFQMHLDARFAPPLDALLENFERFAELGLSLNVSELDVQVAGLDGTRAEKLAVQKQIYQRVVAACAATRACESVTTWGFTDRYSWIDATVGPDDPLEFDDAILRKPAYYGMVDGFVGLAPDPEGTPPNLVPNSSFEAGDDGWFGLGLPSVEVIRREHTGKRALFATGRTETWQGPGTNLTASLSPGWTYDASAWVSIRGKRTDSVRLTAKVTCAGEQPTFLSVAAGTAERARYTQLAGTLELPLCEFEELLFYAEGPEPGVELLLDDVSIRPLSEPLGPNVVTNGDFETGIAGWVAWAGTIAPSSVAHGGSGSVVVTNRTDTWQGPVYDLGPGVSPGATYKIGGFARIAGATSAPVAITVMSVCGSTTNFTPVATATGTDQDFVELSGSYLVPACNDLTSLALYFEGPPAGVDLIVDDVSVEQRLAIPVVEPPPPPAAMNLIGNGGFEFGAGGWFGFGASVAPTTAFVHAGSAAGVSSGRTATWQGPAVTLPSGPATYAVEIQALQAAGTTVTLALSTKLTCGGADSFGTVAAASSVSGVWTELAGTLTIPAGCSAAVLYVQQFDGATFPDLYVDDLVVTPVSVTNLSGNPGFESGTVGWSAFGGALTSTSAFVHSGTAAGWSSGRSADWMGPAFSFPNGAGTYSASLFALQNSGSDLPFVLSVKLTCNGADSFPTVATANGPSGAWVELAGTFPVASGCSVADIYLHQSGGSAFPDIYVDDLVALPAP